MKKILYIIMLGILPLILFSCYGGPESGYPSEATSSLIAGQQSEITMLKVEITQQDELTGLWKSNNIQNNTFSHISFDQSGYVQEDVYSELTGEILTTIEGQYSIQNDRLQITLVDGNIYQFSYLLTNGQLKLTSLSN